MYEVSLQPVSSKSLVIDLLSTMPRHHPVAVGALVRAAALFGVGENSMRVTLARLRSRGLIESDQRGFYRLSRAALAVNREVRAWPSIDSEVVPWDGSFVAVDTSHLPKRDRKASRTRNRALRLLGFESLSPALKIRPNNLRGGPERCRERLAGLGFSPAPLVVTITELDLETNCSALGLWNVEALHARYETTRVTLEGSLSRLPTLSREAAMVESFRIGGEAVRQIVLDPLLPEEIVNAEARRAMFDAMRTYDRAGRDYWKQWTGTTVEPERSPVDMGRLEPSPNTIRT
ncbi:MAG: phenylacetic acid degradation operon negative regulatory protein [Myxococcota bacterium]|jgi:phenylacetic acid degradation operon negative regulatory protein